MRRNQLAPSTAPEGQELLQHAQLRYWGRELGQAICPQAKQWLRRGCQHNKDRSQVGDMADNCHLLLGTPTGGHSQKNESGGKLEGIQMH